MERKPVEHTPMPGTVTVPQLLEALRRDGGCLLTVTGDSMLPFLHHRKSAVLLGLPGKLRRGQIVFFRRDTGAYILHRIRKVQKDGRLCICGDAQAWTELIFPEQVLAVVVAIRKKSGDFLPTDSLSWRLASALWYPTRPIRPWLLRAMISLHSVFRKR